MNIMMNKSMFKKSIAFLLMAMMMLAILPIGAFATTGDIAVDVTLDTRTLDRHNAVLEDKAGNTIGNKPMETFSVTVPAGSTVYDVLMKVAQEENIEVIGTSFITDIGQIGSNSFTKQEQEEYLLVDPVYGLLSGWVYSVDGFYPAWGMNQWEVVNGADIRISYTVTGAWDPVRGDFIAPEYPNLDLIYLDKLEQLKSRLEQQPDSDAQMIVDMFEMEMQESEGNNEKGFISQWLRSAEIYDGYIPTLDAYLAM